MDSPERSSLMAAADDQGSPIFNFLCSLSPIKLVKSVHVAQTFSELSFPPPPTIFVTPRLDSKRDTNSSKMKESQEGKSLSSESEKWQVAAQTETMRTFPSANGRFQGTREVVVKKEKDISHDSPVNSPSKLVDRYLAEPMEMESTQADAVNTNRQPDLSKTENPGVVQDVSNSARAGGGSSASRDCGQELKDGELIESLRSTHIGLQENKNSTYALELDQRTLFRSEDSNKHSFQPKDWQDKPSSLSDASIQHVLNKTEDAKDSSSSPVEDKAMPVNTAQSSKVNFPIQHRGFRRRCLDFEEGQGKSQNVLPISKQLHASARIISDSMITSMSNSTAQMNVLNERALETSGVTTSDFTGGPDVCSKPCLEGAQFEFNYMRDAVQLSKNDSVMRDSNACDMDHSPENLPIIGGVRSGIGLHLNSLNADALLVQPSKHGSTMVLNSLNVLSGTASARSDDEHKSYFSSRNSDYSSNVGAEACDSSSLLVEEGKINNCDMHLGDSEIPVSATEHVCSVDIVTNNMQEMVPSCGFQIWPNPVCSRGESQEDGGCQMANNDHDLFEQSPPSPKKKRRSSTSTDKSGEGCKRCNCKKSKCLKLYCECFAAGVYCVDSCSCQGCQNKPEFEETVLETRQQIESRNPLAFAPKVVLAVTSDISPLTAEKNIGDTPPARHKRGCNCKKSKCLKKYCECYQAGVGCSDGCRCENCQNVYGRKEGSKDSDEKDISNDTAEKEASQEQMDVPYLTDVAEQQHHNLSPITPSLEYMGHNRSMVMSRSANRKRFSLEEQQSPPFLHSSSKIPRTPSRRTPSRLLRSSKETENTPLLPSGRPLSSSPISTPGITSIDQFSPGWDGLADICTLTPIPRAPIRIIPASTSKLDEPDSSPSLSVPHCNSILSSGSTLDSKTSKYAYQHKIPSADDIQHSRGSVESHNTPSTPALSVHVSDPSLKLPSEVSRTLLEKSKADRLPEFQKDSQATCSPVCTLKTSSPKRKRVSPPSSSDLLHGSFKSPGLRSGRKFILRSIPSTPSFDGS